MIPDGNYGYPFFEQMAINSDFKFALNERLLIMQSFYARKIIVKVAQLSNPNCSSLGHCERPAVK